MTSLFEDLKTGLSQAIEYEKGEGDAKVKTISISPLKKYTHVEIRGIRMKNRMSQAVLAKFMGVSKKTVEAWECGRTHPTGPALRLLHYLDSNGNMLFCFEDGAEYGKK